MFKINIMIGVTKGLIVDNTSFGLSQLADANGTQLVFTKTVGTAGKACEKDFYTATGTTTLGFTWSYTAEATENPAKLRLNVKKTPV